METITISTRQKEYEILFGHHILEKIDKLFDFDSRVFLISDSGVPECWKQMVLSRIPDNEMFVFEQGEKNKNLDTYRQINEWLLGRNASRKDIIIGLGGGVVGDLSGFVAATYMRGIRYINIPTTSLAQIDSSIGGKTAVDLNGVKNIIGAFWQPELVIIDPETLTTLPVRQLNNGLAEAVKMGMILDSELFDLFEREDLHDHLDEIILRSLYAKAMVVEKDEREASLRKILNFGHTLGHAYETDNEGKYLHGECVAMGMMKMCDEESRKRLSVILRKLDLPLNCESDPERIIDLIRNDKKAGHDHIDVVLVDKIGEGRIERWDLNKIRERL